MLLTGFTHTEWTYVIGLFLALNLGLVIDYFENKHSSEVYTKEEAKRNFIVPNVCLLLFFIAVYFKDPTCSTNQSDSDINQSKIEQRLDRIEQKLDRLNQNEKSTKDKDCDCN